VNDDEHENSWTPTALRGCYVPASDPHRASGPLGSLQVVLGRPDSYPISISDFSVVVSFAIVFSYDRIFY